MKHVPLIRANVIQGFAAFLEETGSSTKHLLVKAKLPISALYAPESLLPFRLVARFYEEAAREEGCEHLGLLVGQRTQIADLGTYGRFLCQLLTLHDAIHTGIHMGATYTSGEHFWLEEHGQQMWLRRKFVNGLDVNLQQADQFSVMLMINLIRLAAGEQWRPTEIHLETQQTRGLETIESLADVRVRFTQSATAVVFPRSLLSLPLKNSGERQDLQRYKDYQLLYSSAPATNFPDSVRQIVSTFLHEQQADIRIVAEIVGMSVRTFQRQLNHLGLTYSHLVEQVRFEHSLQLLHDPGIKLTEIASELGYTDAANFTRAFKRWTGVCPTEFRHLRWQI